MPRSPFHAAPDMPKWRPGIEAGRALFASSNPADFAWALSHQYGASLARLAADDRALRAKQKAKNGGKAPRKSGDASTRWGEKSVVMRGLVKNDQWWREKLPQILTERGCMSKDDMRTLLAWKWARGKYRPGRARFEAMNRDESVLATSKACLDAAAPLEGLSSDGDNETIDAAVRSAVDAATKMPQVGPATATAILAARFPETCPFYADEAMESLGLFREPYTLARYLEFARTLREKAIALGAGWTAEKVGRALWAASKARALGLDNEAAAASGSASLSSASALASESTRPKKKPRR